MQRHGTSAESFARVAVKNHRHSVHNPRAQLQREYTLEEVMASPPDWASTMPACPRITPPGVVDSAILNSPRRNTQVATTRSEWGTERDGGGLLACFGFEQAEVDELRRSGALRRAVSDSV